VQQDNAEAVKWFRLAAERNNATAQHNLGVCYENGIGVTADQTEAQRWYDLARKNGSNK
jgi:TPR repeat protein